MYIVFLTHPNCINIYILDSEFWSKRGVAETWDGSHFKGLWVKVWETLFIIVIYVSYYGIK